MALTKLKLCLLLVAVYVGDSFSLQHHKYFKSRQRLAFHPSSSIQTTYLCPSLTTNNRCSGLFARRRGDGDDSFSEEEPVSDLLRDTSKSLRRVSFFSWWSQVILSTISAVILLFSRNVLSKRDAALSVNDPSFFLSGTGLLFSAVSILWTWGNGARLSRRLIRQPMHRFHAAQMLRRAVKVGVSINLSGLLVHLLAAEEIVGSLAIQVLTSRGAWEGVGAYASGSYLQPLDVLVVQANTNALLSHFCSLVLLLYMTKNITALDPPSSVGNDSTIRS